MNQSSISDNSLSPIWLKSAIKNPWLLYGTFAISFLALSFFTFQFGVDDSFITFRYARNLVEHGVWNWNSTGPRVEAYTNFIYAVLAIIPEYFGLSSFIFFKLIGSLSIVYLGLRLHQILSMRYALWVALTFILINPLFYIHAYSGLETPVFVVLLFELIIGLTLDDESGSEKRLYLIMLLLTLTRPEGAMYSIVGFIFLTFKKKKIDSKSTLGLIFIGASLYFYLRYVYFEQLLPNTFYVKSDIPFEFSRVIGYLKGSKIFWSVLLLFLLVKNLGFRVLLLSSLLINLLYASSDLQMNFADRFPFQSLAPFYLSAIVLLSNSRHFSKLTFLIILFVVMVWTSQSLVTTAGDYPSLRKAHGSLGVALSKYRDENLSLMAGDVGLIPFYSGWQTFDFIGLANKRVARGGMSVELVREMDPDLILVYGSAGSDPQVGFNSVRNQKPVMDFIRGNQGYQYVGAIKLNDSFYLLAYLKKSVKSFNQIKTSIAEVEQSSNHFKVDRDKYLKFYYARQPD